ncbi:glutathione S-transferase family protein [Roseibium sediminicola]|uniref:Glutathione S-transferase family protein n=1 Tax=Roseibium sediminicola TaxID=2933272 RepID=A0ABT0GNK0_9HYPH|nr:glutathione S-transferase family protein [Roseibium sp. CAU 1639]
MNQCPPAGDRQLSSEAAVARYRLHGSPDSANLVVRMVLEELGVAYDYVPVDRLTSQQKSEAYRRLNPQGLIPVLEVPGQDAPLFETGAILLYLADRHGALAPEKTSSARGRYLKWLFFLSNTLHSDLRISFKVGRYLPDETRHQLFADTLLERISAGFLHLEAELETTGGPWLLGPDFTVADIYLAACARWTQIYGNKGKWDLSGTPRLRALCASLETRPAIRRACDQELIEGLPFTQPKPVSLPGVTG